jgi:uncharacterized membrane protein YkvA (DUF1232 family)
MKLLRRKRFRIGGKAARQLALSMIRELPNLVMLVVRLIGDRRVSAVDKALFAFVLVYIVTPADLLPDFVVVLGFVDDLYLVALALGRMLVRAGPDRLLEHWRGDPATLGYFVESAEQLGGLLPAPIRRILARSVKRARATSAA